MMTAYVAGQFDLVDKQEKIDVTKVGDPNKVVQEAERRKELYLKAVAESVADDPNTYIDSLQPEFKEFNTGAQKHLDGKLRVDLVTPEMIEALATVLTYGAKKYAARNWEKGIPYMTSFASAMRHMLDFAKGDDIDSESGLYNIEQAMLNLGMIVTQIRRNRTDLDDRPSKEKK